MKSQPKFNLNWTRNISVKPSVLFPSNENYGENTEVAKI